MAIFLKGYGNKNYRSFGETGVLFDDLSDINVIIGENNGGKTNVLRSLEIWESSRRGTPIAILPTDYYDNDYTNQIEFEFEIPKEMIETLEPLLSKDNPRPYIRFILSGENYSVSDSFVKHADHASLQNFCQTHMHSYSSDSSQNVQSVESHQVFRELLNKVPPIYYLKEKRVQATPNNFRKRLAPIWSHGAANRAMVPIKKALRDFIEQGFESKVEIQFEQDGESFTIEMNDELVPFEALGSGFQQVFDVALTIASVRDSIILIDEPELNMHPNLLRRLMKLIFANDTNQYIICTHSNVLLDASYAKSIFKIKGGKSSIVEKCDTLDDTRDLLNDLGVKASDILQANGIVWVEGPSDRTYIKHWLDLQGSKAQEGLDYTFQYYGGSLLAHYTVDEVTDFVNILDMSRNAFLVMDSDWKDGARTWTEADLAERKKNIIKDCKLKNIPYWVTSGREIENYISDKSWTKYEGRKVSLAPNEDIGDKSKSYKIKAKDAHDVIIHIDQVDYRANEELMDQIKTLDQCIKAWNTM